MKTLLLFPSLLLLALSASANVLVFVQATNGLAGINYNCTAGEVVRAFALDVTVDQGQILGITNYFRGPCTAAAQGYGIFPASFRDKITVSSGSNANWSVSGYSPWPSRRTIRAARCPASIRAVSRWNWEPSGIRPFRRPFLRRAERFARCKSARRRM